MNLTALVWLVVFLVLSLRGFSRPVFACCAYMLTFYAPPQYWWWGEGLLNSLPVRWNLVAALIVVGAVVANWKARPQLRTSDRWFLWLMGIYVVNAFFVNWFLANLPEESAKHFDLVWKSVGLALVMRLCIWERDDLHILLFTIVLLSAFIGFQVVVNDAGTSVKGRLEGLQFPGASGSNGIAAVLCMSFPLIGYFVIANPFPYSRIAAVLSAPLVLDTILRCNSRGAYLGAAAGGICLVLMARGKARKYAGLILVAGAFAFCIQAQNSRIWERLFSVAASAEERDYSAQGRIELWIAGLNMIGDYPLGSGGRAAFVSPRGMEYIEHLPYDEYRAIHNGYLNIMAGWGVQGFLLLAAGLLIASLALVRAIWLHSSLEDDAGTFLGAAIFAALVSQAVITTFGDYLDGEWFIWLAVFGLGYAQLAEDSLLDDLYEEEIAMEADEPSTDTEGETRPLATVQFP